MVSTRWNLVWLSLVILIAVGLGAVSIHISKKDLTYKKTQEWEYINEIKRLKLELTKKSVVYVEKVTGGTTTVAPIIQRLKPLLDPSIVHEIDKAIMKYSAWYKIPPELVVHVMKRESNFNTRAFSPVGAVGLMQIFPKWHLDKMEEMGILHEEVYHIDNNIRLGCWILREYIDSTGTIDKALTKYVGGKHDRYIRDILVGYTNEAFTAK